MRPADAGPAPPVDLALTGFGHVARRFVALLEDRRGVLERQYGLRWRIVGIATRRHGLAVAPSGLDPARALGLAEAGRPLAALHDPAAGPVPSDTTQFIDMIASRASSPRTVLIETTVLDVETGEPATSYIRQALGGGLHAITANKGPVAFAYDELRELAHRAGRRFLFEGTVLDGIPVFNLVRRTLPAVEVVGFRGVLNSTTNVILTRMEEGGELEPALAEMQRAGIAEADASLDIDGWDAAAKTAALINVLMGGRVTPRQIDRTGIAALSGDEVRNVHRRGGRVKLVASASRSGPGPAGRVTPEELPASDPLAGLSGVANALILQTDLLGEIAITQLHGGLTHTAYALLSDLVEIWRSGRSG